MLTEVYLSGSQEIPEISMTWLDSAPMTLRGEGSARRAGGSIAAVCCRLYREGIYWMARCSPRPEIVPKRMKGIDR